MTDVRRSEEDKEAETETEANEGRWHSAGLEVGHFPIIFLHIWPLFFRDFISSIALYKPEENGDEKKKEKEEKKVEKPEKKQVTLIVSERRKSVLSFFFQQHQFTELEVMTLWNSFKIDFPEDTINKIQLNELVTQLFPK